MNTHIKRFAALAPMAAVQGALVAVALGAFAGHAAAQGAGAMSSVELGSGDNTQAAFKAAEYNGLQRQGALFVGDLDLRAPQRYDSDSSLRWRITGSDLGFDTRGLNANVGKQGAFRITFAFDQMRRNRSDTYETPLLGAGTNDLTLPAGWMMPVVDASLASPNARGLVPGVAGLPYLSGGTIVLPTATQLHVLDSVAGTDVPLFNRVDLFTRRTRFDAGVNANLTSTWSVDADFRPEKKTGTKPMGTVSQNTGGDISMTIPDPIDYTTDQFTSTLNYRSNKGFIQLGYYGSFFRNGISSVRWQNWASAAHTTDTISSMPSNNFNQVNATLGASLSQTTRVTGNLAYSRTTQNDSFVTLGEYTPGVPVPSLNGLVVTTSAYGKITSRPWKTVSLSASYKFDDHDNQTPVRIFQFFDAENPGDVARFTPAFPADNPLGPQLASNADANRPYSRKQNLVNTDADVNLGGGQFVRAGYDFEAINRWCPGSWIDCADVDQTKENTLRAEWRTRATENVQARVDYAYAIRRGTYNEDAFLALVPYANVVPNGQTLSAYQVLQATGLTGYGPIAGYDPNHLANGAFFPSNNILSNTLYANRNNLNELVGMRRFYVADRNRNTLRSQVSVQPTDALSLAFGGDVTRDIYPDSAYGVQNYSLYSADVDLGYALPANFMADLYYTYENNRSLTAGNYYTPNSTAANVSGATALSFSGASACDAYGNLLQRDLNNKIDPCNDWTMDMRDRANTYGLGLEKILGRADLSARLTLTRQTWDGMPTGGSWSNNSLLASGSPANAIAAYFIPATALPATTTNTAELRVDGRYHLRTGTLHVSYAYLKMTNGDWMYEDMQPGTLNGVLPTMEQPFTYSVSLVSVSYVLTFTGGVRP